MVRFEYIYLLYGLFIIPVLIGVFILNRINNRKKIRLFGKAELIDQLVKNKPIFKHQIKFILLSLSLALIIIASSNLQFGSKKEKVKREGVDIVVAIDLSRSMMAEDIKPNRLENAKQLVYNMLSRLQNDRVGIVVFAGKAYVQMPITVDYSAARLFLSNLNTEMIPTQGTAIGDAIDMSKGLFNEGEKKYKVLFIISDGENHEDDAVEAAKQAAKEGIVIHTIGVGSANGAPIPIFNKAGQQVDFMKDQNNSIVLSKLNEQMMQEIATAGKGKYFRISGSVDIVNDIIKTLSTAEKKEISGYIFTDFDSKYQYFLFAGLFFLILELLIFESRSKWYIDFSKMKLVKNKELENLN